MKKVFLSILVSCLSVFATTDFANYKTGIGSTSIISSVSGTNYPMNLDTNWIYKCSRYGTNYGLIKKATYGYKVGMLSSNGTESIIDSFSYNSEMFDADSIYIVSENKIYVNTSLYPTWQVVCTLSTIPNFQYFRTHSTGLYLLYNSKIYKVKNQIGANTLLPIVADVTVKGFNIINDKIWYTTESALNTCDMTGSNKSVVKSNPYYNTSNFAVDLSDTSFYYTPTNKSYLYFDKYKVPQQIANHAMQISVSDSAIFTGNLTFKIYSSITKKYYLGVITPSDSAINYFENSNYFLCPTSSNQAITGKNNSVETYQLNFRPVFRSCNLMNEIGSVNNIFNARCSLNVKDCNPTSNISYSNLSQYSFVNLIPNNKSCILSISNTTLDSGSYSIKIKATNNYNLSDTMTYNFHIFKRDVFINTTPSTSATEDLLYSQTIDLTDKDNDTLYVKSSSLPSWLSIARVSPKSFKVYGTPSYTSNNGTVSVVFTDSTKNIDPATNLKFQESSATLTYNVTIHKLNKAPVFVSNPVTTAIINNLYQYFPSTNDRESDPITYSLITAPSGMTIENNVKLMWTPTSAGYFDVTVKATDAANNSSTQIFKICVSLPGNIAPVFTSRISDTTIDIKTDPVFDYGISTTDENYPAVVITATGTPNGTTLQEFGNGCAYLVIDHPDTGTYPITIKAVDQYGLYSNQYFTLRVKNTTNYTPIITTTIPTTSTTVYSNTVYTSFVLNATDANNTPLSWSAISCPSFLSLNSSTRIVSGTIPPNLSGLSGTAHKISIMVSDGSLTDTATWYITICDSSYAPYFTSTPDTIAYVNQLYSHMVVAKDPNIGSAPLVSTKSFPSGMSMINSNANPNYMTKILSWTPSSKGTYPVSITITDCQNYITQSFNISVIDAPIPLTPPVFNSTPVTTVSEDNLYSYTATTTTTTTIYPMTLPSFLTFSSPSTISGTPVKSDTGTHTVSLIATDLNGLSTIQSFVLTVQAINHSPVITSTPSMVALQNTTYNYQVNASDKDNDNLTYNVGSPSNMTISPTGLVSWTSTQTDVGNHTITITVTDSKGISVQQVYTLIVTDVNDKPIITSNYSDTTIKETDSLILNASYVDPDNTQDTIIWYKDSTELARGSVCKILPSYTSSGEYVMKVVVKDNGYTTQKTFKLNISNVNQLPTIQLKQDTIIALNLNQPISFYLKALDPDGEKLTYSIDTTTINNFSITYSVNDSIINMTLKRIVRDTIVLIVSDGIDQIKYNVILIPNQTTSVINRGAMAYTNFIKISKARMIQYGVKNANNVSLIIYTANGRAIQTINKQSAPGNYSINLPNISSGYYFYTFKIGSEFRTSDKLYIVK